MTMKSISIFLRAAFLCAAFLTINNQTHATCESEYSVNSPLVKSRTAEGKGSLFLNRFLDATETLKNRLQIRKPEGKTRRGIQLIYNHEDKSLKVYRDGMFFTALPKEDQDLLTGLFDDYLSMRQKFLSMFFQNIQNRLMVSILEKSLSEYKARPVTLLRINPIEFVLNGVVRETLELYEAELESKDFQKKGKLPEDFKHKDVLKLMNLEVAMRGEDADRSAALHVDSRSFEYATFMAVFGGFLAEASIIPVSYVDEKKREFDLFGDRGAQMQHIMGDIKVEFVKFLIDPRAYTETTQALLVKLHKAEEDLIHASAFKGEGRIKSLHIYEYLSKNNQVLALGKIPETKVKESKSKAEGTGEPGEKKEETETA